MKTQKALISFVKVKDHELAHVAQNIINKMTSNAHFGEPKPALMSVQEIIITYSDALLKAKDGSKLDTAYKNACRLKLENALSSLGSYVNLTAETDIVKLESSGFPLSKIPEPIGILEAPTITVTYGNNPGEIHIECSVINKASGYIILYSPLPAPIDNNEWYSKQWSSSKGTLTQLKSEIKHVFKAAAMSAQANKMGIYNFSDPVEKMVP
jgi:hypothetical protein